MVTCLFTKDEGTLGRGRKLSWADLSSTESVKEGGIPNGYRLQTDDVNVILDPIPFQDWVSHS